MALPRFLQDIFDSFRRKIPSDPVLEQGPETISDPAAADVSEFDYSDTRIPDASRDHIRKVLALIEEIEAKAAANEIWCPMLVEIHQLSKVHLPALVKSYIDIPAPHRAEIFRKTGRSASFLLNDGLNQMAEKLRVMSRSLAQGNIDAFTTTMRFIETRYGPNDLSPD